MPHHAVEKIQSPQSDGLVLVIQTLQDQVLVRLHRLRVRLKDLGHSQQTQVFHCNRKHTQHRIRESMQETSFTLIYLGLALLHVSLCIKLVIAFLQ